MTSIYFLGPSDSLTLPRLLSRLLFHCRPIKMMKVAALFFASLAGFAAAKDGAGGVRGPAIAAGQDYAVPDVAAQKNDSKF